MAMAEATGPAARPVAIPGARAVDFTSAISGRPYRLLIHVPDTPAPAAGHPLLVILDGNLYFAGAVDSARLQGRHFITPPVILAVGYQTDDLAAQLTMRMRDLTPWIARETRQSPPYLLASGGRPLEDAEVGGLDDFLDMIEREALPIVRDLAPIDASRMVLFGHSLGGRAALHALFGRPPVYAGLVASAPSIWWDGASILAAERDFRAAARAAPPPKLLLAVGALEEEPPRTLRPAPVPEAEVRAMLASIRMVGHVVDMGARLAEVPGYGPDRLHTVVFPEEDHVSVVPAVLSRSLRFMFGRAG